MFSLFVAPAWAQEVSDTMSLESLMAVKVTTASKQAEDLSQAPVPTTVITRKMIDAIGARSMREVLVKYVPGITSVQDHNEMIIGMRGVYASSQQQILFMVDGHRINSRAYSMANPDFSMNLDKVERIEVVRGPGSALYGNVSLTAVINVITRDGGDMEGMSYRAAAGNHGQTYASAFGGSSIGEEGDVVAWSHYYNAHGEERSFSADNDYSESTSGPGTAYIQGAQDNYDIGVSTEFKNFDFLFNVRRGKIQEPFSSAGSTGQVYRDTDYETINGEEPGLGQQNQHLRLGYEKALSDHFTLDVDFYTDRSQLVGNIIANPVSRQNLSLFWWDQDIGGIGNLNYNYDKGNVMVGGQVDWMQLYDSFLATSTDSTGTLNTFLDNQVPLLQKGQETIYSGFAMWKHRFTEDFILNGGLRYDNKNRHKGPNVDAISPRIALIYSLNQSHTAKISYSRSFVDAPYWYRYNSLASYSGSENLKPQFLQAYQLTIDSRLWENKIYNNLNFFYQDLDDFLFRDVEAEGTLDDPKYKNAGSLQSFGVEEQATLKWKDLELNAIGTFQYALESNAYDRDGANIANIPMFSGNLITTYHLTDQLFINTSARYLSRQFSPISGVGQANIPDHYSDAAFILDAGLNFQYKNATLDARVRNLTDTDYRQGGSVRFPYPQRGTWYTISLQYDLGQGSSDDDWLSDI